MSSNHVLVLAAIAGMTIFIGLPVGRLRNPAARLRTFLNATAIGILVFLLFDVFSHANEPVETSLTDAVDGTGTWARFAGLAAVLALGVAMGLLGLVHYERHMQRSHSMRTANPDTSGDWSAARRLAFLIALGIGLHNFSEGLAIGQSAASGEISLAVALVIGFGLHNATEGFGIVAPLAAAGERPSCTFLGAMGLLGGGPTFVGTLIGRSFVNDTLFVAFLALAAGSILYVVVQLVGVAGRQRQAVVVMWGLFVGLVAGFSTDYILVAAGA